MRDEFASNSFLAAERFLAVTGVVLLFSGYAFGFV